MMIEILKSKIHNVSVTGADLNYVGSVTIDEDLMDAAGLVEHEKVHVLNRNNGDRLETYVIKGLRGSGEICLNGPAARRAAIGDVIIIMSYAMVDLAEARTFTPHIIVPDTATNKLV
jgi:aspartate 1-decarboxylase